MPATTKVAISRPQPGDVDEYGDEDDGVLIPIATGLPAIIVYRVSTVRDPATGIPVQVDNSDLIVDRGTDIRDGDTVTDMQDGAVYQVVQVRTLPSYGLPADVWVTVKRTTRGTT